MSRNNRLRSTESCFRAAVLVLLYSVSAQAQVENGNSPGSVSVSADRDFKAGQNPAWEQLRGDLQAQMRELQSLLTEMRTELSQSRADIVALRAELQETRAQIASQQAPTGPSHAQSQLPIDRESQVQRDPPVQAADRRPSLTDLQDDIRLLTGKVDEQYQTKVEAASKYRVRLSGIILTNVFANQGVLDNQDVPSWAEPRAQNGEGSFGATLRQSQLGLEVFGPEIARAKARADIQLDFAGGFSSTLNGVAAGIVRLRTAAVHFDWQNTSLVAGQDTLFFSPLSPTSLASLAIPALAYSGNLWSWTPQVRMEHRLHFSENSSLNLEAGILDPLTGESPADQFLRAPSAGERSKQPAYATHVTWTRRTFGRNLGFGAGGYYSRQDWGFRRSVDSWTASADWTIPFGPNVELSGEFYRGRAVGGLGGAVGQTVLFDGPLSDSATHVRPLNSLGGWTQLKFLANSRWEFNGAFGQDNPFAEDLARFPAAIKFAGFTIARNQSAFVNFIYHPRSDLLFSVEYRHLETAYVPGKTEHAGQLNLSVGVLF